METHRRVTEEDLIVTEALIAQSYSHLKQSVMQAPSRACRSFGETVGQTIREHPYASAATAVVAGAGAYGILNLMTSRPSVQEVQERSRGTIKHESSHPDLMQEILLMMIPLAAPYLTDYIQKYLGSILSVESNSRRS